MGYSESMKIWRRIAYVVLVAAALIGAAYLVFVNITPEPLLPRPDNWAQPIELAGVPNLHMVNSNLYRSAQPSAAGMANLQELGIKTVVNLRSFHSDAGEIGDLPLDAVHIRMKSWHPEREDVVSLLKIAMDTNRTPVLVHCQHGADRTGAMSAAYRMAVENWSGEEAIQEMTRGGYNFHSIWVNLPGWVQGLDFDGIRREVGISGGPVRRVPDAPSGAAAPLPVPAH